MPKKTATADSKCSRPKASSRQRWLRNAKGTFEVRRRGKDVEHIKIANYGLRIETVLFVIGNHQSRVRYELRFLTPTGSRRQVIRHEDMADEQVFLNAVLPGFALTSTPRTFALLRECLMADMADADRHAVLTHLGWWLWRQKPVFAHAGGVICPDFNLQELCAPDACGSTQLQNLIDIDAVCSDVPILAGKHKPISAIHVECPAQLNSYRFRPPKTKAATKKAVRTVLELLAIGDPNVTYVAISALFATTIENPRFAIFLYGETGSLKTAFALLLLSFFVPGVQESDCASFKSTENALRARFAASGNVPVVLDDYVQLLGARNGGSEAAKAENVVRSIVNGSGKDRCSGDGTLKPNDRPLGLPIITGELLPDGLESLKRRTINLPVDSDTFKEAVYGPRPNQFDKFQLAAKRGVFADAMAAFIAWATPHLPKLREFKETRCRSLWAEKPVHHRLVEAAGDIMAGAAMMLTFAKQIGACDKGEYDEHLAIATDAAESVLERAYTETLDDCPTQAFGQLLQSAMSSLRCHIEVRNIDDYHEREFVIPLELLGYTEHEVAKNAQTSPSKRGEQDETTNDPKCELEFKTIYRPHGKRIGWIEYDLIDLIPDAALAEANSMAAKVGAASLPRKKSFGKLLAADQWIAECNKDRNTYKVRVGEFVHEIWRIHSLRLFEIALDWSEFDIGTYKALSAIERRKMHAEKLEQVLRTLRNNLADFQSERLLNPFLTNSDKTNLLIPEPVETDYSPGNVGESTQRYIPAVPGRRRLPGYDSPLEEDAMEG